MTDLSDPAARAASALARARARERAVRITAAVAAAVVAATALAAAGPLTGKDGAWVGAIVLACGLLAVAAAIWPQEWSDAERRHRELDATWRALRSDADEAEPYARFLPWATSTPTTVELSLIELRPSERYAGAPSPYRSKPVKRLNPDEVATAAEEMERLRSDAEAREFAARDRHARSLVSAEHAAHEKALRDLDREAVAYERQREQEVRRELAAQEAAERAEQAEALARALRKP